MIKFSKNKLAFNLIFILCAIAIPVINYFFDWNVQLMKIIAVATLVLSVVFVWLIRKSSALVVLGIFILHCNYSVVMGVYFDWNVPLVLYKQLTNVQIYGMTIGLLFLTMVVLCLIQYNKPIENISIVMPYKNNTLLFWLLEILLIIICIYSIDAGYGRAASLPIFEYASVFFIILIYYSGRNIILDAVVLVTVGIYCLTALVVGNRVEMIAFILVVYIMYFANKVKAKNAMIITVVFCLAMEGLGYIRYYDMSLSDLFNTISKVKFEQQTAIYAYFPTLAAVELRENGTLFDGLENLFNYAIYVFLGSGVNVNFNILRMIEMRYIELGGMFSFATFYYWLKEIGVVIYSFIVIHSLRLIYLKDTRYLKLLGVYLCATCPRWYLYGPQTLIRGALLFSLVYFVCIYLAEKVLRK